MFERTSYAILFGMRVCLLVDPVGEPKAKVHPQVCVLRDFGCKI
jgi:hypothetical protein